jgi:transposase
MEERVTLNKKEQKRLMVLNQIIAGKIKGREGAVISGLSLRHVRRLLAAYRKEGAAALAHGNRGRKPQHALDDELREHVIELGQTKYAGFNHLHLTELLGEREGVVLSRSTVRRVLLGAGIKSPRKRRPPKHRSRRERYPQRGMLLQIDGSDHDWLEGRGPRLTLIGAIDDATGEVPYALFREEEDSQGYFLLLRHIVESCGIPMTLYHDKHGIFERLPRDKESIEEELEGKRTPTQFGRLMEELNITSLQASSPQAKGRIERLWGTLQGRLVSELRLAGARTIGEANKVLWDFLPRHNSKFTVPPAQPGSAYRQLKKGFRPEEFFCFKYGRTVGPDNVVRFGKHRLQIEPDKDRSSYTHARVEVHERMDGSIAIYYRGKYLVTRPAPAEAPVLRARNTTRVMPNKHHDSPEATTPASPEEKMPEQKQPYIKPGPKHPWRTPGLLIDRGQLF